MKFRTLFFSLLAPALAMGALTTTAQAGVFTTPRFVDPGKAELGLEPELVLTSGAGIGFNARFKYGLTELNNVTAILGSGSGPRRFRVGGNATFDFFPDIEGQPGIGIAVQALHVRLPESNQFELTAMPYLHKTFGTQGGEVEPFLSIPFGMGFEGGRYRALATVVVGTMFKNTEHIRYSLELGVAANNTQSYISGGVAYAF